MPRVPLLFKCVSTSLHRLILKLTRVLFRLLTAPRWAVLALQRRHISLFFHDLLDWVTQDDSNLPFIFRASRCYRDCYIFCLVVLGGGLCRSSVASRSNC